MTNVTTLLIKELRTRTGVGVIDCKRALMFTKGNIDKSIDFLRKMGQVKAENKQYIKTKNGAIFISNSNDFGVILELNCETDFVVKNKYFLSLGKQVVDYSISHKIENIDLLKENFENVRVDLISKINENISISRIKTLKGKYIISYLHGNRIGVLIKTDLKNDVLSKNLAMHIAASNPKYLKPNTIPQSVMEREYQVQLELAMQSKKSEPILEKIIKGRMIKFSNEISLFGQNFIFNPQKKVQEIIKENNIHVYEFVRLEVGENYI